MHYDRDWTFYERARVEAIGLLMPSRGAFPDVDALFEARRQVRDVHPRPRGIYSFPWDRAAEARWKLDDLMWCGPDGERADAREYDSKIIASYREFADILHPIPDGSEAPF